MISPYLYYLFMIEVFIEVLIKVPCCSCAPPVFAGAASAGAF